jgi:DNA-binding MarR family transcriptional regulator
MSQSSSNLPASTGGDFILYTAPDGAVKVDVFFKGETVWLTQKALAELFGVQTPAVNKHLKNIYASGELTREATISKMETVQTEGGREIARQVEFYNLDAATAVVISYLLDFTRGQTDSIRERVDNLFLLWLRHPGALGAEMKRYQNIQRVEWLRRVGDLLETGRLNVERDRSALERFLGWVDSWEGWRKGQHQTISAIEFLKQRFHAPRLWVLARLHPESRLQPRRDNRFRRR